MSTPNDLDVKHIEMVAQDALFLHRPRKPLPRYVNCTVQDMDVCVRVNEPADLGPVETALRQFGYRLERIENDGQPSGTRVTGWSPDALRARGQALGAAAGRLADTTEFESTVGGAVDIYRALRAEGYASKPARDRASTRAGGDLNVTTAHEIGPLVHTKLTPDDPDIAAQVAANDTLFMRVTNLLFHHARLAADTLNWVAEHADTLPAGEAKTRALEVMRPQIIELRETATREADHALFGDAYWWVHEQASTLALGFASWSANRHDPNNAPELAEAFRHWVADGLLDSGGVDVLTGRRVSPPPNGRPDSAVSTRSSAAQVAAADVAGPPTEPPPPAASTEPAPESSAEPPAPERSPRHSAR